MTEKQTFLDRLINLDYRIVLIIVIICISIPIIQPLGLPTAISMHTQIMYDQVESLEQDAIVFGEISMPLGAATEAIYTVEAIAKHLFSRDIKQVWVSLSADGPVEYEMMMEEVQPEKMGKIYGIDWVYLGYIAGAPSVTTAAIADDVWQASPTDYFGNSLEDLPLMSEVKTYEDQRYTYRLRKEIDSGQLVDEEVMEKLKSLGYLK